MNAFRFLIAAAVLGTPLLQAETFPAMALPTADGVAEIRFDFLEPGFTVRELPVRISNLNNIEYAPDGRVFAVGYDGRVHVLRDTDGDGLEDTATLFWQGKGDYEMPLGLALRDDSIYLTLRRRIERLRDTTDSGVANEMEVVATGWHEAITETDKTFLHRRVDDAIGLAIDPQGNLYTSLGCGNYQNLYQLDAEGKSRYSRERFRGSVVKIAPGGKPEIIATGIRFLVSMQFNKAGDLFATDQEGATWGPGNPFDELLQIERGRHYGFPPYHAQHLPDVFDEPSVVDFGPQHQSTCGFRFNEERAGFRRFGPADWEGNAIVTGESRGKLWRVPLVKTGAGYVGKPVLIGATNLMPIDVTISPDGDLLMCCHSGKPDWGTGPKGEGRLFKISHTSPREPRLAAAWPSSGTEIKVALTEALPADATFTALITGGRYVQAGYSFETFRPGYAVVKNDQANAPRYSMAAKAGVLSEDRRTISFGTAPHPWLGSYELIVRWESASTGRKGRFVGEYDFHGMQGSWKTAGPASQAQGESSIWLPYPNLEVARRWTIGSAEHERFFQKLRTPGTLSLSATFEGGAEKSRYLIGPGFPGDPPMDFESRRFDGPPGAILLEKEPNHRTMSMPTGSGRDPWLGFFTKVMETRGPKNQGAFGHPMARTGVRLPWAPSLAAPDAPPKAKDAPEFVRGDVEKGRQAFATACAICHAFRGQGAKVGPDLSNSPERDPAGLREDIVNPSAALNPDYIGYELTMQDGKIVIGTIASDRPGRFLVQQPGGALIEVAQADIKSMRQLPTSLMPAGLGALGDEALRDIITYLITPAGK